MLLTFSPELSKPLYFFGILLDHCLKLFLTLTLNKNKFYTDPVHTLK